MADTVRMKVVKCIECLTHNKCCLCLSQMFPLCNEKEKFTSFAQSIKFIKIYKIRLDRNLWNSVV